MRRGKERDLLTEARYWLAETYYRLDRFQQADALFRQVARGPRTADFTVWSLHSSGWTALRLNDMSRARDTFSQFQSATPAELEAWARHGLGLANYALGRHDDAVAAWTALAARAPASLARDVAFWLGEALGRVGQYDRAISSLTQFVTWPRLDDELERGRVSRVPRVAEERSGASLGRGRARDGAAPIRPGSR